MGKFFRHPKAIVESKDIGGGTRIWAFSHVCAGVRIGRDCNIGENCYVESGVKLGNLVTVKNGVCLWEGVEAENRVFIGPQAVFTNELYPRSKRYSPHAKIYLREGAAIGANATILCGVTIGRYATVGAAAVVTKNVSDFTLVYGNPAVFKGFVCKCGDKLVVKKKEGRCRCGCIYTICKNIAKEVKFKE